MRLASIGAAGAEFPAIVSDDGLRFRPVDGGSWRSILEGGGAAAVAEAARAASHRPWESLEGKRFGPPIPNPTKIVAIGLNYRDHALEQGKEPPAAPLLFAKAPSCLIGDGDAIVIPPQESRTDAEAELAVVVGRRTKGVDAVEARAAVLGYTIMNDLSGREAQYGDKQWFRGKSYDTYGPCGPWIVTADEIPDPHRLPIRSIWNGVTMQESDTSQLIHDVDRLIAYISRQMTLVPGDIIATGTPAGVGVFRDPPVFLRPGDRVRIEIDGIGRLENPVTAA